MGFGGGDEWWRRSVGYWVIVDRRCMCVVAGVSVGVDELIVEFSAIGALQFGADVP